MAAENFQKGNKPRPAITAKAVYVAVSALTSTTTIAPNVIDTVTITVPFQFKGATAIVPSLAPNDALDTGLALGSATLLAPASGSYSAGNHPRVAVQIINETTATVTTAANHDIYLIQL